MAAAALATLSRIAQAARVPPPPVAARVQPPAAPPVAVPRPPRAPSSGVAAALASIRSSAVRARARDDAPLTSRSPDSPRPPSSRPPVAVAVEAPPEVRLTPEEEEALERYRATGRGSRELREDARKALVAFQREAAKFYQRRSEALEHQALALQAQNEVLVHARMADDETAARQDALAVQAWRSTGNALDNLRIFAEDVRAALAEVGLLEGAQSKREHGAAHTADWQADAARLAEAEAQLARVEADAAQGPSDEERAAAEAKVVAATGRPILREGWAVIATGDGSGQPKVMRVPAAFVDGQVRVDPSSAEIVAGPFREEREADDMLRFLTQDRHYRGADLLKLAKSLNVPRQRSGTPAPPAPPAPTLPAQGRGWVVVAAGEGSGQTLVVPVDAEFVDGKARIDRNYWGSAEIVAGPFRDRREAGDAAGRLGGLTRADLLQLARNLNMPRLR
jgi:hypothetical protein